MRTNLDIFRPTFANPWKEFASLQKEMDRLFGNFSQLPVPTSKVDFLPACDVEETDSSYLITVDVPGIPKDKIKVELLGDTLTIVGEHQEEHKEEKGKRRLFERYQGRFERSFVLPGTANTNKVEANYKDGVLKISVPKTEASKSRRVPITDGEEKKVTKAATQVA